MSRALWLAPALSLLIVTPVLAYVLYGHYTTSAIDSNLDRQADLSVCFGSARLDPIYVNRYQIGQEIERWHNASIGDFTSFGLCDNDGSNIVILWGCARPEL